MKLVYIPGACSLAIHIALNATGEDFETIAYNPAERKTEDGVPLSALTSKPYVPALILRDGDILHETAAILMTLDEMFPKAGLLPRDPVQKREAREWLVYISSELHKTFAPLFSPATPQDQIDTLRARIADRFDFISKSLSESGPHLLGDGFYAPDMYLYVMTLWAKAKDISLDHWPSVAAFQAAAAEQSTVIKALTAEGLAPANEEAA